MASNILRVVALVGAALALPQPDGWEGWPDPGIDTSTSKTTTTKTTTTTTTTKSTTTSDWTSWSIETVTTSSKLSLSTLSSKSWHKWNDPSAESSAVTPSSKLWSTGSNPSPSVEHGWNDWKPSPSPSVAHETDSNDHSGPHGNVPAVSAPAGSSSGWGGWDSDNSEGSWVYDAPPFSFSAPETTYEPAIYWTHDLTDVKYVEPCDRNSFYLAIGNASPTVAHEMAWLHVNFTSQAVVLDHSSLLTYIYDSSSGSLQVAFKTQEAYNIAHDQWTTETIIVFHNDACVNSQCWLKAEDIDFTPGAMSCHVGTHALDLEGAVDYYDFEWGQYNPGSTKPGSGTSTSIGTNSGSSTTTKSGTVSSSTSITTTTGTNTKNNTTSTTTTTSATSTSTDDTEYDVGQDDNTDCTAPIDTKYGLPTACLGQFFDEDLDNTYGYQAAEDSSFADYAAQYNDLWEEDPEPLTDEERADWDEDTAALNLARRHLDRRGIPRRHQKRILPLIVGYFVVREVPVEGLGKPYNNEFNHPIDLTSPSPGSRKLTPTKKWGDQYLLAAWEKKSAGGAVEGDIKFFCVDCGTKGSATLQGKVGISVRNGVDYLSASAKMNLEVSLQLGLELNVVLSQNLPEKQIFEVGIPSLAYPPFLTIGPYVRVGAEVSLELAASGNAKVGGILSIKDAYAEFNVVGLTGKADGWKPEFTPVFEAGGEIKASAKFGLPIALALGITAASGNFRRDIALVDKPSLEARAEVAGAADLSGGGITSTNGCNGIDTALTFQNDLYIQWPNNNKLPLLNGDPIKLAGKCIEVPGIPIKGEVQTDDGTNDVDDDGTSTAGDDAEANGSPDEDTDQSATDEGNDDATTDNTASERRRSLGMHKATKRQSDDSVVDITSEITANATVDNKVYVPPARGDRNYTITNGNGYTFAVLTDHTKNYQVLGAADGNLLAFTRVQARAVPDYASGRYWAFDYEGSVGLDGSGRLLTYYPDEMSKTGVSRLRLANSKEIPVGTDELILYLGDTAIDGKPAKIYYPVNSAGTTYYPFVCHYSDSHLSQVFIAADATLGPTLLQSPDIKYSITGGDVDACYFLPLVKNNGRDSQASGAGQFDYGYNQTATSNTTITSTSTTVTRKRSPGMAQLYPTY